MQLIVESNTVIPIGVLSINARVYGAYTQVMITILKRGEVLVFLHCYNDVPNPLKGVVRLDDAHELICLPFICNSDQAKGNGGTLTNWALKAYNGLLLQQLFFILRLLSIFLSASLFQSLYQSFHWRLFL